MRNIFTHVNTSILENRSNSASALWRLGSFGKKLAVAAVFTAIAVSANAQSVIYAPPAKPIANSAWNQFNDWEKIGTSGIYWVWHEQKNPGDDGKVEFAWTFFNGYGEHATFDYQIFDVTDLGDKETYTDEDLKSAKEVETPSETDLKAGSKDLGESSGNYSYLSSHGKKLVIRIFKLTVGSKQVIDGNALK